MMENFHCRGKLVRGSNPSFIVLVPKKEATISLNDYRSISLIGCAYKVLSKPLTRRLGKVLDNIISDNQGAFISKRHIFYGVVILNEALDESKKRKMERVSLKIDFCNV